MILRVEVKVDGKIMHVIEREVDSDAKTVSSSIWEFLSKAKTAFGKFSPADFLYFK